MKITLNRIAFATCMALGASFARASDNFVGLIWGQTDNNIQKSNGPNANLGNPRLDNGRGFSRDSNVGYAAGLQAGIQQEPNGNTSIEGGYRYLRTSASTEMSVHGAAQ